MTPSVRRPSSAPSEGLRWFAVKVVSGREESVKEALERHVRIDALEEVIGRILIPVENVVELRKGRRVERTRKLFTGYLLCELACADRAFSLLREIPNAGGTAPMPLSEAEADRLLAGQLEDRTRVVLPEFDPGDRVRVLRGAFAQLEGEVDSVLPTGLIRVRMEILGRPVSLELEASEILQLSGK
ncbi:MAG: transcription termination/antitermination protein NusG [Gemmataceae bacterium]